ncbi:MAG: magnesium transporter CorA family protein [Candidatus ainarchaeum sp.]|nr:magnesium transporter CorA family protein [Candidatus ainarchaeum sp.]
MIEYFKPTLTGLKTFKKVQSESWIHLSNPTEADIEKLSKILKIKKKDFEDLKQDILSLSDEEEIPLFDLKNDGLIFIIIKTPEETHYRADKEYDTVPLGIILTKEIVVTISFKKNNNTILRMKEKKYDFNTVYFTLRLMLTSTKSYLYFLKLINKKLKRIEDVLERHPTNKEMSHLLDVQKSLVYFNTSLTNNYILFEKVSRSSIFLQTTENEDLIADLLDETKQAIQTNNIYSDNLKHTLNVVSSLISNNLNRIVKFLTSMSIIIAIPTLVASLYGMNVILPFQESPSAFLFILLISFIVSMGIGLFLWHKKLF